MIYYRRFSFQVLIIFICRLYEIWSTFGNLKKCRQQFLTDLQVLRPKETETVDSDLSSIRHRRHVVCMQHNGDHKI